MCGRSCAVTAGCVSVRCHFSFTNSRPCADRLIVSCVVECSSLNRPPTITVSNQLSLMSSAAVAVTASVSAQPPAPQLTVITSQSQLNGASHTPHAQSVPTSLASPSMATSASTPSASTLVIIDTAQHPVSAGQDMAAPKIDPSLLTGISPSSSSVASGVSSAGSSGSTSPASAVDRTIVAAGSVSGAVSGNTSATPTGSSLLSVPVPTFSSSPLNSASASPNVAPATATLAPPPFGGFDSNTHSPPASQSSSQHHSPPHSNNSRNGNSSPPPSAAALQSAAHAAATAASASLVSAARAQAMGGGISPRDGNAMNGSGKPDSSFELKEDLSNLIVNYLPTSYADDSLRAMFRAFGSISQCKVVRDKKSGQSLGYGFVKFEHSESAAKAVAALNGFSVDNKKLKVAISKPPNAGGGSNRDPDFKRNLYISGLPLSYTPLELSQLLSTFGAIVEARVLTEAGTRQSRGVGFVILDNHSNAQRAIDSLHGRTLEGGTKKLVVKFADKSSENANAAAAGAAAAAGSTGPSAERPPLFAPPPVHRSGSGGSAAVMQLQSQSHGFNPLKAYDAPNSVSAGRHSPLFHALPAASVPPAVRHYQPPQSHHPHHTASAAAAAPVTIPISFQHQLPHRYTEYSAPPPPQPQSYHVPQQQQMVAIEQPQYLPLAQPQQPQQHAQVPTSQYYAVATPLTTANNFPLYASPQPQSHSPPQPYQFQSVQVVQTQPPQPQPQHHSPPLPPTVTGSHTPPPQLLAVPALPPSPLAAPQQQQQQQQQPQQHAHTQPITLYASTTPQSQPQQQQQHSHHAYLVHQSQLHQAQAAAAIAAQQASNALVAAASAQQAVAAYAHASGSYQYSQQQQPQQQPQQTQSTQPAAYHIQYPAALSGQSIQAAVAAATAGVSAGNNSPPQVSPRGGAQPFNGVCLFVYHLPADFTEQALAALFAPYCEVLTAKVMKDLKSGVSKGFGFVNVASAEQAEFGMHRLDGFQLGNKFLKVSIKK